MSFTERILADLKLSEQHSGWLQNQLILLPQNASYRAIIVNRFADFARAHLQNEARAEFDELATPLTDPNPFAMSPVENYIVAALKLAVLSGDEMDHPIRALRRVAVAGVRYLGHNNPLIQTAYLAAEGDFFEFLDLQTNAVSIRRWQNFGEAEGIQASSTHFEVHHRGGPAELLSPGVCASMEGCFELFDDELSVDIEILSPTSYTLHFYREQAEST